MIAVGGVVFLAIALCGLIVANNRDRKRLREERRRREVEHLPYADSDAVVIEQTPDEIRLPDRLPPGGRK